MNDTESYWIYTDLDGYAVRVDEKDGDVIEKFKTDNELNKYVVSVVTSKTFSDETEEIEVDVCSKLNFKFEDESMKKLDLNICKDVQISVSVPIQINYIVLKIQIK